MTTPLFSAADVPVVATRAARVISHAEPVIPLPALLHRGGTPQGVTHPEAGREINQWPVLTVDVEHTGYPIGHRHYQLRTIQLGNEYRCLVLDASCDECLRIAGYALNQAEILLAYSATADLVPLVHAGMIGYEDAWGKMFDVMIRAKLADPNSDGTDAGLKDTAHAVLGHRAVSPQAEEDRAALFEHAGWLTGVDERTAPQRNGWYQVDPRYARMVSYAAADVLDTASLARALPRLPRPVLERERALQHMVARISHVGLPLDPGHIKTLLGRHKAAAADSAAALAVLGLPNPGSRTELSAAFARHKITLPLTEKGNPSLAASVLRGLACGGEDGAFITTLLDYRHHTTLISTFLEPKRIRCDYGDGRERPTIYTLTARTARMSSVRPNKQNEPRAGGIRACTTADPGHLLISADLSGIEYRVAAAYSGDAALLDIVLNGSAKDKTDLHWRVAKKVFGPDATKANRYTVKPGVYGKFYGGGAETLAHEMGCAVDLAQQVCDEFDDLFPTYTSWTHKRIREAQNGKTTRTLYTGRVLHVPRLYPHKAPNYEIQSTAREILADCLLRWRETPWGNSVVLPVHDEVIAMVPANEALEATAALLECMTSEFMGVPITAAANEPSFAWQDAD